jgi:hypothetical protein
MKNFISNISGKTVMLLCIAACALPFIIIMEIGGQANLTWLALLACVDMHLVMMKMMPGHKSCHGDKKEDEVKKLEDMDSHTNTPLNTKTLDA